MDPYLSLRQQLSCTLCRALCRPFAQRYNVLLAVGKGMYKALDMDTLDEARACELCRQILQVLLPLCIRTPADLQKWTIMPSPAILRQQLSI